MWRLLYHVHIPILSLEIKFEINSYFCYSPHSSPLYYNFINVKIATISVKSVQIL